jgi:large subunit ribosomal protein L3
MRKIVSMIKGLWGKKIGMTQLFVQKKRRGATHAVIDGKKAPIAIVEDVLVPVTVIDTTRWVLIGTRNSVKDGYNALRLGYLRDRYTGETFSSAWLSNIKKYFQAVREIKVQGDLPSLPLGKALNVADLLQEGKTIDIIGTTRGRGFAGVVKRHGFTGGPASHGAEMGRFPGSNGHMHAEGKVIKGKRLPGRMGGVQHTISGLEVMQVHQDQGIVLVKGATPGKSGAWVYIGCK